MAQCCRAMSSGPGTASRAAAAAQVLGALQHVRVYPGLFYRAQAGRVSPTGRPAAEGLKLLHVLASSLFTCSRKEFLPGAPGLPRHPAVARLNVTASVTLEGPAESDPGPAGLVRV